MCLCEINVLIENGLVYTCRALREAFFYEHRTTLWEYLTHNKQPLLLGPP